MPTFGPQPSNSAIVDWDTQLEEHKEGVKTDAIRVDSRLPMSDSVQWADHYGQYRDKFELHPMIETYLPKIPEFRGHNGIPGTQYLIEIFLSPWPRDDAEHALWQGADVSPTLMRPELMHALSTPSFVALCDRNLLFLARSHEGR
jgi:hypothetical protein